MDLLNDCNCIYELVLETGNDLTPTYRAKNICLTHLELIRKYKKENAHLLELVDCLGLKVNKDVCDKFHNLDKHKQTQISDFLRYILSELIRDRYDNFLKERKAE